MGARKSEIVEVEVDIAVISAKTAEAIEMPFMLLAWMGRRNHELDGDQASPSEGAILGKGAPIPRYRDFLPSAVQKRIRLYLPFGLWTRLSQRKHKFNRIRQVAPMCPHGRAHWCKLGNTIELSVCGSDAALCQITLTTCYYYKPQSRFARLWLDV